MLRDSINDDVVGFLLVLGFAPDYLLQGCIPLYCARCTQTVVDELEGVFALRARELISVVMSPRICVLVATAAQVAALRPSVNSAAASAAEGGSGS